MHTLLRTVFLVAGALALASRAHATAQLEEHLADRYQEALQRAGSPDNSTRRAVELSEQDVSAFSGVGMIACTVDSGVQTSTAFLVGAFDIGITVAHTFENGRTGIAPTDCVYTSIDSTGQVRERIPVAYIRSQWESEAGAFGQPTKDIAVFRLSEPSRYAQKTMPLGRFTGAEAPVVMVGYRADIGWSTSRIKTRGMAYQRTHDMDSRGIAPGAPVVDERTGVIIGIHTLLPKNMGNGMITMTDWLETTLRSEIQLKAKNEDGSG